MKKTRCKNYRPVQCARTPVAKGLQQSQSSETDNSNTEPCVMGMQTNIGTGLSKTQLE
ncbi:hypothetical protein STEG23_012162, partial [Scotinomys teguina]